MEAISIVIPTYNRAALLPDTLRSVLAAAADEDEIVVVDDGSTDATATVLQAADAPWQGRLRYLQVANGGAGRARNIGVATARHDLIAFADSDDLWLPWRLALQRPLMTSERQLAFCFSDFGKLARDGSVQPHRLVDWSEDHRTWDDILAPGRPYAERWPLPAAWPADRPAPRIHVGSMYRQQLHAFYINANTLLVRRSVAGDALRFAEDLPVYEDLECFARIARAGDCAYLDVDTALQRSHDAPRLTQAKEIAKLQAHLAVIERTWAADPDFRQAHGRELEARLAGLRRNLARQLIRLGRCDEAAAVLRPVGGAWLERFALGMPRPLLRAVMQRAGRAATTPER